MNRSLHRPALCALALASVLLQPAFAQSDHVSRASSASLGALGEVPSAALELVAAGAQFSVVAMRPLGESIELVLEAGGRGVSFAFRVSTDVGARLGIAIGTVVTTTAVAAGYVLSIAGTVVAFIPSAATEALIHHRELQR
jgi:hypothetical protein